jgi:hypothetical protein
MPDFMRRYFDKVQDRKDGLLLHHAVAALLPSSQEISWLRSGAEVQLQELLDEFDNIDLD